ncbi:uncharacterized protein LOC144098048 [Amblyomma americanum]
MNDVTGVSSIPVAFVLSDGGAIRLNNPEAVQAALRSTSQHFMHITDVWQFGRGGILCRSPDKACIEDLLKCTSFANHPVSAFIPPHLACSKGLVRGVDSRLSPAETLENLSPAGVIAVHRCSRMVDGAKIPTESVIATFAGIFCPSEIKVWPLVFRVDAFNSRPLQCQNCWRFGHSGKACKSALRCCACGERHCREECPEQQEKCCLCSGAHSADSPDCPARAQEVQVLELIDKRRCTRREAFAAVKERTSAYSSVAAKCPPIMDSSWSQAITAAVEKAVANAMDRIMETVSTCISQVIAAQMTNLLQASTAPFLSSLALEATPPSQWASSTIMYIWKNRWLRSEPFFLSFNGTGTSA